MKFCVPTINHRNFEAFISGYEIDAATGCWIWLRNRSEKGYGRLRLAGRGKCKAHRVSWEIAYGPVPVGIYVLHRCDNPPCVNPEHLFLGTHADNMADMAAKGRARGRIRKENLKYRGKLKKFAKEIRDKALSGEHLSHLAKQYGVSYAAIRGVVFHRQWKTPPPVLKRGRPRKNRSL